jgi:hypothetical protein
MKTRRGARALISVSATLLFLFGLAWLAPATMPRAVAQDPTLDAALNAIAQRTREAAGTQTREARNAQQTREARDAQIAAERATAQALAVEQTRTALEQTRATLTRQADDARATRQSQQDATATAQARSTATARAEQTATAQAEATATMHAAQAATVEARATATQIARQTATVIAEATATWVAIQRAEDARQQQLFIERATVAGAVGVGGVAIVLLALALARWVWVRAKKPAVIQIIDEPSLARASDPATDAPVIERIEQVEQDPPSTEPPLPPTRIVFDDPEVIDALDRVVAAQTPATRSNVYEREFIEPIE